MEVIKKLFIVDCTLISQFKVILKVSEGRERTAKEKEEFKHM